MIDSSNFTSQGKSFITYLRGSERGETTKQVKRKMYINIADGKE